MNVYAVLFVFAAIAATVIMLYWIWKKGNTIGRNGPIENIPVSTTPSVGPDNKEKTELDVLLEKAHAGDAQAQCSLGKKYLDGNGDDSKVKAVKWFTLAAEQGHGEALYKLSGIYYEGIGVTKDEKKGIEYLKKSAGQGCAEAQFILGMIYEKGESVARDFNKALELFNKAAENGYDDALWQLVNIYKFGKDVPQDDAKAFDFILKLAKKCDSTAQNALSTYYALGNVVPKNYIQAYAWLNLSAMDNDKENIKLRDFIGGKLTQDQLKKAQEMSLQIFDEIRVKDDDLMELVRSTPIEVGRAMLRLMASREKSPYKKYLYLFVLATSGDVKSQYNLGVCFYSGDDAPKNYDKAIEWWIKASEQGFLMAMYNLGFCYANCPGIPKDLPKAAEWYAKAAERGHAESQLNLGVMYGNGQGVSLDYKESLKWLSKAAENGNIDAKVNLGIMYNNGKGVPQDYKKSFDFFLDSALHGHAKAQLNLIDFYSNGWGTLQNYVKAYAWMLILALEYPGAQEDREKLAGKMIPAQIAEAQALSEKIQAEIETNKKAKTAARPPDAAGLVDPSHTGRQSRA